MSFDWHDYLKLAEELANSSDDASRRSSVSRAYYGAYHAAWRSARARFPLWKPGSNKHKALWKKWSDEDARLGSQGKRLKDWRVKADYDQAACFPATIVRQCLEDAKAIVAANR